MNYQEEKFFSLIKRLKEAKEEIKKVEEEIKNSTKEYLLDYYDNEKFTDSFRQNELKRIREDWQYTDSKYLTPVIQFIKGWMDEEFAPVIYAYSPTNYIDIPFNQWFGEKEEKDKLIITMLYKIYSVEKECCERRNKDKSFSTKFVTDVERFAKERAIKQTRNSEIRRKIFLNIILGRAGICRCFSIKGNSEYECGCIIGKLDGATSIQDIKDEGVKKYFKFVYKDKFDRLK